MEELLCWIHHGEDGGHYPLAQILSHHLYDNHAFFLFWLPLFTLYKTVGKRNKIAQEILATEQTYVNSLKVVVQLFLEPLRDPANKQIITTEDLRSIFSEIEVILGYNGKLLGEIEQRMEAWSFDSCLGDIFSKMVSV